MLLMKRRMIQLAFVLRIVCALALVSIGFAQDAQAGNRVVSAGELAHYVLPDGQLPDLCITLPDGSGGGKIVKLGSDTLGAHHQNALFMPHEEGGPAVRLVAANFRPSGSSLSRQFLHTPGGGPRAPPASPKSV